MYLYNKKIIEKDKDYYTYKKGSKFMPTVIDDIFHIMINNEKRKKYASLIISEVLHLDYEYVLKNIKLLNNKLDKNKVKEATKTVDCLCLIDEYIILIEMNRYGNKNRLIRNIEYLFKIFTNIRRKGDGYKYKKVRLINIDNFRFEGIKDSIIKYRISNTEKEKFHFLTDICEIYHISLPNIRKKMYTNSKLTLLERFMLVMNEEESEKLKEIIGGNKIMEEYRKDMDSILEDGIITLEEHEEIERHFRRDERLDAMAEGEKKGIRKGVRKGAKEKSINIARNMLKRKCDVNFISEVTGLSSKQIASFK